jgi:molecular chaperone GrpE
MSDEVKHWGLGFQMILTQFRDVLAVNGVQPFPSKGHHFDPHFHEAVETEEREDTAPGIVIEEFTKGYKMGDKTIRPARVKVAKALPTHPDKEEKAEIK